MKCTAQRNARAGKVKALLFTLLLSGGVAMSSAVFAAETVSYRYDELGRVIRVEYVGGPNNGLVIEYSYDAAGNRTAVVVS